MTTTEHLPDAYRRAYHGHRFDLGLHGHAATDREAWIDAQLAAEVRGDVPVGSGAREVWHHSQCWQLKGVPSDLPADLCDCATLLMLQAIADYPPAPGVSPATAVSKALRDERRRAEAAEAELERQSRIIESLTRANNNLQDSVRDRDREVTRLGVLVETEREIGDEIDARAVTAERERDEARALVAKARRWIANSVDPVAVGEEVKQQMLDTLAPAAIEGRS